jgi:WD40 repeat protein
LATPLAAQDKKEPPTAVIPFVAVTINEPIVFDKHVFPILAEKCLTCHDEEGGLAEGDLDLTAVEAVRKGGKTGPAIVPGKGAESRLIRLASRSEKPFMPPKKEPPLTSEELSLIKLWIDQGAGAGTNPKPMDARRQAEIAFAGLPAGIQPVFALDMDKLGQTLAAGRGNHVFMYDVASGGLRAQLAGHKDLVQSLALSTDGKWLAAGGFRIVTLWNVPQDLERTTLTGHAGAVRTVAATPDGKFAASTSEDKTLRLWDLTSGKQTRQIDLPVPSFTAALRPDGSQIAVVGSDNRVRIHDLTDGKVVTTLEGYAGQVLCVAYSPDARWLATGTADNLVRVWDLPRTPKNPVPTAKDLKGHGKPVRQVAFAAAELVVSASEDGTVRLWTTIGAKETRSMAHGAPVVGLAVSAAAQLVAGGGADGQVKVWRLSDGGLIRGLTAHSKPVFAMEFSKDGKELVTGGEDQTVLVWDPQSGQLLHRFSGHAGPVICAGFGPSNGMVLSASADKTVKVWNAEGAWGPPIDLGPFVDRVTALDFSPDGKLLATGGGQPASSGEVIIWDVATAKKVSVFGSAHSDTVLGAAFSPDGKFLATTAADKFLKVHEVATGKLVKSFEGHTAHVLAADWKADGKQIASAGADNALKIWSFETGEQVLTVGGHGNQVTAVRWIGPSDRLVSSCGDRQARRINGSNGGIERGYGGPADFLHCVATSESGNILAAGGQEGKVFVWDGNNGNLLRTFDAPAVVAQAGR